MTDYPLGPNSPLRDLPKRPKLPTMSEFEMQREAVALLIGDSRRGEDRLAGMIARWPELVDLYAIPNGGDRGGGARGKAAAGKARAEGVLASAPDLCLPVPRYPFHGLYLELKKPGVYPTKAQRELHERWAARGYLVVVCRTVQAVIDTIVGYLALTEWGVMFIDGEMLESRRAIWRERLAPGSARAGRPGAGEG